MYIVYIRRSTLLEQWSSTLVCACRSVAIALTDAMGNALPSFCPGERLYLRVRSVARCGVCGKVWRGVEMTCKTQCWQRAASKGHYAAFLLPRRVALLEGEKCGKVWRGVGRCGEVWI